MSFDFEVLRACDMAALVELKNRVGLPKEMIFKKKKKQGVKLAFY